MSVSNISETSEHTFADSVLAESRSAQRLWSKVSLRDRLAVVKRFRHSLADNALTLAKIVEQSRGSKAPEVLAAEILPLADACRFLEREAKSILRPKAVSSSRRPLWLTGVASSVHREPLGVILVLGPANYPLFLPGVEIIQAITSGNSVLVKPGHSGGEVMKQLSQLLIDAGLPEDVIRVLPEDPQVVEPLLRAGVDKIFLTGSAKTGQIVAKMAAETLTPMVAELSGCDAVIVLPGANLDLVADAIEFSLRWNRSETCIAARRLFVPRPLVEEIEHRLTQVVQTLRESWQPTARSKVAVRLIEDALNQGARLLVETNLDDDNGLSPVVLTDVSVDMEITREDVFAPVLSIIPVSDSEEAIRLSAKCPYALGASVFGPESECQHVAKRIDAGAVVINDIIVSTADPRLPFGGRKRSGFGVTRGVDGLLEMTTVKSISRRRGRPPHLDDPHPTDGELFHRFVRATHGRGWRRFGQWWFIVRLMMKRLIG